MTYAQHLYHFENGIHGALAHTAILLTRLAQYVCAILRTAIVLIVALLYVIEGAHNVLKYWVDEQVSSATTKPALPTAEVALLDELIAAAAPAPVRRQELEQRTCPQLRDRLADLGATKTSKLRKAQLIDRILMLESF